MPKITVTFEGICTFFTRDYPQLEGHARAVLVRASGETHIDGYDIPAHAASVAVGDDRSIAVDGVRMRLTASPARPLQLDQFTWAAPTLSDLVAQTGGDLAPPSEQVVFGGEAALYFDFKSGSLTIAANSERAATATLVVEGDAVTLESVSLDGRPLPDGLSPMIVFEHDTTIAVCNNDVDKDLKCDADFLLHYLTASVIPPNPPFDLTTVLARIPRGSHHPIGAIGAGCSNSNYP